ncbi:hypothetical protein SAMN02745207_04290, partial [Clostridium grantii DSM 8605]
NKGHISALKDTLGINKEDFYKSYIIFSERCTLKKITVTSPNVKVIKRNSLVRTIKKDMNKSPKIMTVEDIAKLYSKLQKYTLADEVVKKSHIDSIKSKIS